MRFTVFEKNRVMDLFAIGLNLQFFFTKVGGKILWIQHFGLRISKYQRVCTCDFVQSGLGMFT